MAHRYLILIPRGSRNELAIGAIAARTGLTNHSAVGSVHVLTNESGSVLQFPAGLVIGNLFHRHGVGPALTRIEGVDAAAIGQDVVGTLTGRYWGSYVALWNGDGRTSILRDPSGSTPCYYGRSPHAIAFASDAELLLEAGIVQPTIDWGGVAMTLYARDLPRSETGLEGVTELLAGRIATVAQDEVATRDFSSPWDFVAHDLKISPEKQAERLRRVVHNSARSWGATHKMAVLAVSGGLDSSIVATCLKGALDLDCFTISTAEPRGNEEPFARALCDELGFDLTARTYQLADADIGVSTFAHLPRPGGRTHGLAYDAPLLRLMEEKGADAFYTGSGGDNVFHSSHSARPLVDQYLTTGLNGDLISTWRDIAALTGASAWEILRHALRVPRRGGEKYRWKFDPEFLSRDALEIVEARSPSHPWLDSPAKALPGKAAHVAMILRAQHYLHGYDRRLPFTPVAPLLSQPVVELCLSIPSWYVCRGGVDRSVARAAFADRFPPLIRDRRIKGGPDSFAIGLLQTNLPAVRERLLDGQLAARGIIDRDAVELALQPSRLATRTEYVRLLLLLDTEAWIEAWQSRAGKPEARRVVG